MDSPADIETSRRPRIVAFLIVAVSLQLVGACRLCAPKLPKPGSLCRSDADCLPPLTCRDLNPGLPTDLRSSDRYCTRECQSDAECSGGNCTGGLCEPSSPHEWHDLIQVVIEEPAPFEVAPWLNAGAGLRLQSGDTRFDRSLGGGVEGTFRLPCASEPKCGAWRLRPGPWLAVDSSRDRTRGEGGIALDLGAPDALAFSTFGLRAGVGRAGSGQNHLVGQVSWGTRFVPLRSSVQGRACPALIAPASGLRLFVAVRLALNGSDPIQLVAGVEWQPFGRRLGMTGD